MNHLFWRVLGSIIWSCVVICLVGCTEAEQVLRSTWNEYHCQAVVQATWGTGIGEVGYAQQYSTVPPTGPTVFKVDVEGNVYIVDIYNDRVLKYDAAGVFVRSYQSPILPEEAWIEDVAPTSDGRIALAVMTTRWHLTSVHILDGTTGELVDVLEWERETGRYYSTLSTFGEDIQADGNGSIYVCFYNTYGHEQPGVILQYNEENRGQEFWSGYWNAFVPGWDGFVYVQLPGWPSGETDPLYDERVVRMSPRGNETGEIYIAGSKLEEVGLCRLGSLLGVDGAGTMYFTSTPRGEETANRDVIVEIASDGAILRVVDLGTAIGLYHVVQAVDLRGNFYLVHYDRYQIPTEPFEIWRCTP